MRRLRDGIAKHPEAALVFLLAFTFTYFGQGGGFNQNATIGEIRELVEHGQVTIERWTRVTGDTSHYDGRAYSNKTPSTLFIAAPAYAPVFHGAQILGVDTDSLRFQMFATHYVTFFCAGLWGALLGLVLARLLGELYPWLESRQRFGLALALPLGTLVFPYATVAFAHAFEAFCAALFLYLFVCFDKSPTTARAASAGIGAGLLVLSNPILSVVSALGAIFILWRSRRLSMLATFGAAAVLPLLPLLTYNQLNFGSPLANNRDFQDAAWADPNLFLGVFAAPDVRRLWYVFGDSSRSVFPSMPLVYLGLVGAFVGGACSFPRRYLLLAGGLVLVMTLFMMSFNGWHGGSCYGPRYFTTACIYLLIMSVPFLKIVPRAYWLLAIWSIGVMLVVTASNLWTLQTEPSPLVASILPIFRQGQFQYFYFPAFPSPSAAFNHYNLGTLVGLPGHLSLVPLLLAHLFVVPALRRDLPSARRL